MHQDENFNKIEDDVTGEVDVEVFQNITLQNKSEEQITSPRKFRNNSYYKAVGSDLDQIRRNLAVRKKPKDPKSRTRALLYQQVKERAILDETMDDEDDDVTGDSASSTEYDEIVTWSKLPGVRESGILMTMTQKERRRQEAIYELYTSEQSYLRSLTVLRDVFMTSHSIRESMTSMEFHHLFSNLTDVLNSSKNFLGKIEARIKTSSCLLGDVCDIILRHVTNGNFDPYVTYCSNEVYQQRAYQNLITKNPQFVQAMKTEERNSQCAGLPLHSFLILPMQRITRLPLLIDTMRQKCEVTDQYYSVASQALKETTKLVKVCNERAKSLQRTEDMITLQRQLEFKTRSFALISPARFLLKRGPLTRIYDETVLGFRKQSRQDVHVLLFNDVIITAKRKGEDKFIVSDFCYKHRLKMIELDEEVNTFQLILERNQDGRRVVLRLQAESPSVCARWVSCLKIITKKEPKADKNCVQVRVVRPFRAVESDIISLQVLDVLAVLVATPDGWYYGERLIDGRRGWFPSTHAKEILNDRAREKNFRRRTRMLGIETTI